MLIRHFYISILFRYSVAQIDSEGIAIVGAPDAALHGLWGEQVSNCSHDFVFLERRKNLRTMTLVARPILHAQLAYYTVQDPFGKQQQQQLSVGIS